METEQCIEMNTATINIDELKALDFLATQLKEGIARVLGDPSANSSERLRTSCISIPFIQKTVANFYKIDPADMTSRRRPQHIARARQVAMFLVYELCGSSLESVGAEFGGRDHGTVLHGCRVVKSLCEKNPSVATDIERLRSALKSFSGSHS